MKCCRNYLLFSILQMYHSLSFRNIHPVCRVGYSNYLVIIRPCWLCVGRVFTILLYVFYFIQQKA